MTAGWQRTTRSGGLGAGFPGGPSPTAATAPAPPARGRPVDGKVHRMVDPHVNGKVAAGATRPARAAACVRRTAGRGLGTGGCNHRARRCDRLADAGTAGSTPATRPAPPARAADSRIRSVSRGVVGAGAGAALAAVAQLAGHHRHPTRAPPPTGLAQVLHPLRVQPGSQRVRAGLDAERVEDLGETGRRRRSGGVAVVTGKLRDRGESRSRAVAHAPAAPARWPRSGTGLRGSRRRDRLTWSSGCQPAVTYLTAETSTGALTDVTLHRLPVRA